MHVLVCMKSYETSRLSRANSCLICGSGIIGDCVTSFSHEQIEWLEARRVGTGELVAPRGRTKPNTALLLAKKRAYGGEPVSFTKT